MRTNEKRSRVTTVVAALAVAIVTASSAHAQATQAGLTTASPPANGHYATVNGIKLYYEIHGTGKPLVLLHGGLGAIEMFGPNLTALAKGRQVIAVDLQAHGRTADIDRPLSIEAMGDDIAALIQELKLGRADVMGYSLGGGVAFQTALRHPEVVDRLVLVSTPIRRNAFYPGILAQQGQVGAASAEQMKQTPMYAMYSALAPRPQDWPRLLQKMSDAMAKDYDYTADVPKLRARTLIVAGDADIFPPAHAVEVFGLLGGGQRDGGWDGSGQPRSRLAILPGLTHYTIFNAPALAETAIRFLDESSTGAR